MKWADDCVSVGPDDQVEATSPEITSPEISSRDQAHDTDPYGQKERIVFRPKVTVNVFNTGGSSTEGPGGSGEGTEGLGTFGNGGIATVSGSHIAGSYDPISDLASQLEDLKREVQRLSLRGFEQRPIIESGTWNTCDVRAHNAPQPLTEGHIVFSRQFKSAPAVVVSINAANVSQTTNFRVRTYATDVTTKGFAIHADSWGDTLLFHCVLSWIAIGD